MKLRLILCAFDRHDFGPRWEDEDGRIYIDCKQCHTRRQVLTDEYILKVMRRLTRMG